MLALCVDAALRLESGDDAEDASNIYAITDPKTGHRGLLIDAFDVFDEICHADFSEQLLAHRETVPTGDRDVPSKHGLRKVYKREFEQEPERYVLREGFPGLSRMSSAVPSASSDLIPQSKPMFGWSQASSETPG